jgi:predicted TIM-barrel enzyme
MYTDPYFVAQLAGGMRGSCFGFQADTEYDIDRFVGCSAFAALSDAPDFLRVCLLDAIFEKINQLEGVVPSRTVPYQGTAAESGQLQARVLADLAQVEAGMKVAVVGAVEDIARELLERGATPMLADLYLAGQVVSGLEVGGDAGSIIGDADAVIMTGNTLKTRTIDHLLAAARSRGARLVVFAMSGAEVSPRYLDFGASAVTVERFPYFWYPGLGSTISIFEAYDLMPRS